MKKAILLILLFFVWSLAHCQIWQTFTNMSHIYDFKVKENGIYLGTWGGALHIGGEDPTTAFTDIPIFPTTWTTKDGISSNDIRSIELISNSGAVWLGSSTEGISIVQPAGIQLINSSNGLPSNRIRKIIEFGSQIFVATDAGLSVFFYLEGVNFPLLLQQYNNQNTSGGLVSNDIADMLLSSSNYLYLSTSSGLSYVHADSLDVNAAWRKWTSVNSPLPTGFSYHLSANEDYLAVSSLNSVFKRSIHPFAGSWTIYNQNSGIMNHTIADVCIDKEQKLWISYGSWSETSLAYTITVDTLMTTIDSTGTIKHWAKQQSGLSADVISNIDDSSLGIIISSWGSGLYLLRDNAWQNFLPNSIGFPKITDIKTDTNHAIWLGNGVIGSTPVRKSTLGLSKYADGIWTTYKIANSPIITDNILNIAVDNLNRKWLGTWDVTLNSPTGWRAGVTIYDDDNDVWQRLTSGGISSYDPDTGVWGDNEPGSTTILSNVIGALLKDREGNMLVGCYSNGVSIISPNGTNLGSFEVGFSTNQRILYMHHSGDKYFFGTNNDPGLVIWNYPGLPENDTFSPHWLIPSPSELRNCVVYGVVSLDTPYEGIQHWIAASTGLFMWNETDWFKYETSIKRYKYVNINWVEETLYYVDEERLFGSVRTSPTAIYLDPFNRIWIGSLEHGISRYNPETERFTNYYMANSPLLSNYITALGYESLSGNLLIGTPDGMNTLSIGKEVITTENLEIVKAYPNPFRPDLNDFVRIVNLPENSMPKGKNTCRIYDSSGAIVIELPQNEFARFDWDGKNKAGKECGSGIYFYLLTDAKGVSRRGKIALIR